MTSHTIYTHSATPQATLGRLSFQTTESIGLAHHRSARHNRASSVASTDADRQSTSTSQPYIVELTGSPSSMQWSTPPPLIHDKSPYGCIPLPPMLSVPVTLHPLLRYQPIPGIEYSMFYSPSSAAPTRPHHTHPRWLQESATFPNLASLTIRAQWQERAIVVFPGEAAYGFVTIWDVLVAVHRALRGKATYLHSNAHHNPLGLFHRPRQRDVMQPDEGTIRASMMILTQGRTLWRGLSPSTTEADVWLLHIR